MTESPKPLESCKLEVKTRREFREEIPEIVDQLVLSCRGQDCFDHVGPEPLPSREAAIDIIHRASRLLYPGYFIRKRLDEVNLSYYFGQEAVAFFEALAQQITLCIKHECLRYDQDCSHCEDRGREEAIRFSAGNYQNFGPCLPRMCVPRTKGTRLPRVMMKSSSVILAFSPSRSIVCPTNFWNKEFP